MGNKIAKVVLGIVFLIVFNVLFFVFCGTDNTSSIWISYGFIHVAYLFLLVTPFFNKGNRGLAVQSMTLYLVSVYYFLVELVTGIFFITVQQESCVWALSVQLILFALFLLVFLSSFLANQSTQQSMEVSNYEATYIKEATAQLGMILRQVSDKSVHKKLEKCYDLMQSSPTQSAMKVKELEMSISNDIESLRAVVMNGDPAQIQQLCSNICLKIEERNNTLRTINKK